MKRSNCFLVLLTMLACKVWAYRWIAYSDRSPLQAIVLDVPFYLILMGIAYFIPPRSSRWPVTILYVVASVFLFGSAGYFVYYGTIVTPEMFLFTDQLGTVKESIGEMWSSVYLVFLLDLPVVLWFAPTRSRRGTTGGHGVLSAARASYLQHRHPTVSGTLSGLRPRNRDVASMGVGILIVAAAMMLLVQVTSAARLSASADVALVAEARGTVTAQIVSVMRANAVPGEALAATSDGSLSASETAVVEGESEAQRLARIITEQRGPVTGPRLVDFERGEYKGVPIIMIQVEALQGLDIDAVVGGKEVTPNFSAFAKQSHYWPNMSPQLARGNTSDVEWSVQSGMNPPANAAAVLEYTNREVPGLPRLLDTQQGYASFTGHPNEARFWNRTSLYPALGFGRYYDRVFYGIGDPMWSGTSDERFFAKSATLIKTADAKGKPYYANLLNLSSHHPFGYVPFDRRPLRMTPAQEQTILGKHLGAISYTDKAFGQFLGELEDAGIADKAIIVVLGDHWAVRARDIKSADDKALALEVLGPRFSFADQMRVPLMIRMPGQTKGTVSQEAAAQTDIYPTLADAVGLDTSAVPLVGRSLFERHTRLVQLRSGAPQGSFVSNRSIVMAGIDLPSSTAVSRFDGRAVRISASDRTDFERAMVISELSDAYLRQLPKRDTSGDSLKKAIIPNRKR